MASYNPNITGYLGSIIPYIPLTTKVFSLFTWIPQNEAFEKVTPLLPFLVC